MSAFIKPTWFWLEFWEIHICNNWEHPVAVPLPPGTSSPGLPPRLPTSGTGPSSISPAKGWAAAETPVSVLLWLALFCSPLSPLCTVLPFLSRPHCLWTNQLELKALWPWIFVGYHLSLKIFSKYGKISWCPTSSDRILSSSTAYSTWSPTVVRFDLLTHSGSFQIHFFCLYVYIVIFG